MSNRLTAKMVGRKVLSPAMKLPLFDIHMKPVQHPDGQWLVPFNNGEASSHRGGMQETNRTRTIILSASISNKNH
jgi:hypothetical protein